MRQKQTHASVKKTTSYGTIPIKPDTKTNTYLHAIKEQIQKLNGSTDFNQKQSSLETIKKLDEEFIKSTNKEIIGQVLLSRHGECNAFDQKKWGVNPNTGLSEESKNNMQHTSNYTKELLYYPDEFLEVAISPLLRALETATFILPKAQSKNITIDAALSENSKAPSGFDVRSVEDLDSVLEKTAWFSSTYYLLSLSKWFYVDAFIEINQKRENALNVLQVPLEKDVQALNYQEDKIEVSLDTIKTAKPHTDLWLIGHGKNFRALYKEVFQISSKFDFAETRRMFRLSNQTLFNPPYVFVINQKNGHLEGKFTGILKQARPNQKPLLLKPKTHNANIERAKIWHKVALIALFTFAGLSLGIVLSVANLGLSAPAIIPLLSVLGFSLGLGFVSLLDHCIKPANTPSIPYKSLNEENELDTYDEEKKYYEDGFQYTAPFQKTPKNLIVELTDSEESESELEINFR